MPCAPVARSERLVSKPAATLPPVDGGEIALQYLCALLHGVSLKESAPRENNTAEEIAESRASWVPRTGENCSAWAIDGECSLTSLMKPPCAAEPVAYFAAMSIRSHV